VAPGVRTLAPSLRRSHRQPGGRHAFTLISMATIAQAVDPFVFRLSIFGPSALFVGYFVVWSVTVQRCILR